MRKFAIRLLTLATYATALVVIPMVAPAEAETSSSRHIKKHKKFTDHWSAGQAWPAARPYSGSVCPGMGRSFDCTIWPPPFDEDPDRKVPGRL